LSSTQVIGVSRDKMRYLLGGKPQKLPKDAIIVLSLRIPTHSMVGDSPPSSENIQFMPLMAIKRRSALLIDGF